MGSDVYAGRAKKDKEQIDGMICLEEIFPNELDEPLDLLRPQLSVLPENQPSGIVEGKDVALVVANAPGLGSILSGRPVAVDILRV